MLKFKGKGVSGSVAFGKVFLYHRQEYTVCYAPGKDSEKELKRFADAKKKALEQLSRLYEKAFRDAGKKQAEIFEVHKLMLEDENYNESIISSIRRQSVSAEYAIAMTQDRYVAIFSDMGDANMQARAADIRDISQLLLSCLDERGQLRQKIKEKVVICAEDLSPSETVWLDQENVLAFVTSQGTVNSHTAILAKSMNIPAVVGVGEDFLNSIQENDEIIVDGSTGEIYVKPDAETRKRMREKLEYDRETKKHFAELKGKENITPDGTRIEIFANIGSVDELAQIAEEDAGGIGLFRSEFIYMGKEAPPSEEQQFVIYRKVLEFMNKKKVIIRTMDIGADKQIDYFHLEKEENPALGLRAIRVSLTRPELLKTQLKALYRASVYGNLGIMFPMITSVNEVEEIMDVCSDVRAELKKDRIPYDEHTEIGIMIETPAAALISDHLAQMVDFFSVGTNDLIQYTLACDRQNANLERFCDPHHEAVLRLIALTAKNAHKYSIRIGICGELAADLTLTETFLRMGIDELSVPASMILPLRDTVRKTIIGKTEMCEFVDLMEQ